MTRVTDGTRALRSNPAPMQTTHRRRAAWAAVVIVLAASGRSLLRDADAQEDASAPAGITDADWPPDAAAVRGRVVYDKYCGGCHGDDGRGRGAAARFLDPLPRNFRTGRFKYKSTPQGDPPLPEDVVRTVTRGLPGSSMPGFPLLPEPERADVAAFVLHLADVGRAEAELAYLAKEEGVTRDAFLSEHLPRVRAEAAARRRAARRVPVPAAPPDDEASRGRGGALYAQLCAACHGATGTGDGPSNATLRDTLDAPIVARDFTRGLLRGGDRPDEMFTRMRTGIDGTPMPALSNPDAEIWDLVHFVLSLRAAPAGEVR